LRTEPQSLQFDQGALKKRSPKVSGLKSSEAPRAWEAEQDHATDKEGTSKCKGPDAKFFKCPFGATKVS